MKKVRRTLTLNTILYFLIALLLNWSVVANSNSASDNNREAIKLKKYPGGFTSFLLETPSGVKIITDPYNIDENTHADIVTESHSHGDHTDVSNIIKPYKLINTCGEFNVSGVRIMGIAGHHDKGDYGLTNIIYVFNIDGIIIAQFASQGQVPTPDDLRKIGKVDLLIIQMYASYNKLTVEECVTIARNLEAKIVIPAHGLDSPSVLNKFSQLLSNRDFISVKSGQMTIRKSDLDKMKIPQVMVLDN